VLAFAGEHARKLAVAGNRTSPPEALVAVAVPGLVGVARTGRAAEARDRGDGRGRPGPALGPVDVLQGFGCPMLAAQGLGLAVAVVLVLGMIQRQVQAAAADASTASS
jgi:hypothetical protein